MSNWENIQLGDAFNKFGSDTISQRDLVNKKVQELQQLVVQLNNEILDAATLLGVSNQTLQSLLTSGFNFLELEPGEGGIITRINNAGNQPPAFGNVWSCGIVIAAQAPSFKQVMLNFQALKNVIDFTNHSQL